MDLTHKSEEEIRLWLSESFLNVKTLLMQKDVLKNRPFFPSLIEDMARQYPDRVIRQLHILHPYLKEPKALLVDQAKTRMAYVLDVVNRPEYQGLPFAQEVKSALRDEISHENAIRPEVFIFGYKYFSDLPNAHHLLQRAIEDHPLVFMTSIQRDGESKDERIDPHLRHEAQHVIASAVASKRLGEHIQREPYMGLAAFSYWAAHKDAKTWLSHIAQEIPEYYLAELRRVPESLKAQYQEFVPQAIDKIRTNKISPMSFEAGSLMAAIVPHLPADIPHYQKYCDQALQLAPGELAEALKGSSAPHHQKLREQAIKQLDLERSKDPGVQGNNDLQTPQWLARQALRLGLPDGVVKWGVGSALKYGGLLPEGTVSTELMTRCINQNKTIFTEKHLEKIDPRYTDALREMVEKELKIKGIEDIPLDKPIGIELAGVDNTADIYGANAKSQSKTMEQLRNDLGRALGGVVVTKRSDGSVTVSDYFDFAPVKTMIGQPVTGANALLAAALQATNSTIRNVAVGRIFCQEHDNGAPTNTSIPIRITLRPKPDSPER